MAKEGARPLNGSSRTLLWTEPGRHAAPPSAPRHRPARGWTGAETYRRRSLAGPPIQSRSPTDDCPSATLRLADPPWALPRRRNFPPPKAPTRVTTSSCGGCCGGKKRRSAAPRRVSA